MCERTKKGFLTLTKCAKVMNFVLVLLLLRVERFAGEKAALRRWLLLRLEEPDPLTGLAIACLDE